MSKRQAKKLMANSNLIDKKIYKNLFFLLYIKVSENNNLTYYQRNREKILSKAKDYYKNLSEEDKIKKREYARN